MSLNILVEWLLTVASVIVPFVYLLKASYPDHNKFIWAKIPWLAADKINPIRGKIYLIFVQQQNGPMCIVLFLFFRCVVTEEELWLNYWLYAAPLKFTIKLLFFCCFFFSPSGPFHDGGLKRRETKFKMKTAPVNTRVLFRSILFYFWHMIDALDQVGSIWHTSRPILLFLQLCFCLPFQNVLLFLVSGVFCLWQYKTCSISKAKLSKIEIAYFKVLYFGGLLFWAWNVLESRLEMSKATPCKQVRSIYY